MKKTFPTYKDLLKGSRTRTKRGSNILVKAARWIRLKFHKCNGTVIKKYPASTTLQQDGV
jgi:hypothetical protein